MPPQRSYDVTHAEGGDAPESAATSKRSWVLWLIGFFVACAVILLLCLISWKPSNPEIPSAAKQDTDNDYEQTGISNSSSNTSNEPYVAESTNNEGQDTTSVNDISTDPTTRPPTSQSTVTTEPPSLAAKPTLTSSTTESSSATEPPFLEKKPTLTSSTTEPPFLEEAPEPTLTSPTTESPSTTDSPFLEQEPTLTSSTTESPSTTDSPFLEQEPTLTSSTTESPSTTDSPFLEQEPTLTSSTTESPSTTDFPFLEQEPTLTSSTTESPSTTDSQFLEQEPTLTSSTTESPSTTDSPFLEQEPTLTSSTTESPSTTDFPFLEQEPTLTSSTTEPPFLEEAPEPTLTSSTTESPSTAEPPSLKDEPEPTLTMPTTESPSTTDSPFFEQEPTLTSSRTESPATTESPSLEEEPEPTLTSPTTESPSLEAKPTGNQITSGILFYMNHSADACEDFYEYACGGFEANYLMGENDLAKQATKRIFDQAKNFNSSGKPTRFLDYYQSCVAYTSTEKRSERMKLVINAVNEVGKFYEVSEWSDDKFDFTTMLSSLLLRNSAPLFDITPDVAVDVEENCAEQIKPAKYTLKIGPPVLESSFYRNHKEYDCGKELNSEMSQAKVNLGDLYQQYQKCTSNFKEFLDAVEVALNIFNRTDPAVHSETRFTIELDLVPAFDKSYPAKGEIRKGYLTKNYTSMTVAELQKQIDMRFLNWTQLLQTLTNSMIDFEQPLQVYFPSIIINGLSTLQQYPEKRLIHNALLGLYASKIYYELGFPSNDVRDYCERAATSLMGTHASSLYLSSFSREELTDMKATVADMFEKLKDTFESEVEKASWLKHTEDTEIVKKIRGLTIETPDISYYEGENELNIENSKEELTGRFFDDTMMLQKNYRKSMYGVLKKSPTHYEQIWTHFALPYQTTSSAIYGLNKIIVPYGAIDWLFVSNAKKISSGHLVLATLGTTIANQIAHHFDHTGVQHFAGNKVRQPPAVFCSEDYSAAGKYQDLIKNYQLLTNDSKSEIVVQSTNQHVAYTISDLSLNDRLADITGLQLAYNTMSRLSPDSKKLLPWLAAQESDENKQFFLAYAQMYCTKIPLASSFVSLHEDEHLPSRLRISITASSIRALANTWDCALGSNVHPEQVPIGPFPYLENISQSSET